MKDQRILFSKKEIEVMKSCIYMAMCEGLYHFERKNIDADEEDIQGILSKFGMAQPEIEEFMEDAL